MSSVALPLADTLTRLIRDQRVSYAHIGRIGHLSRNTIKLIADGSTRHPTADTLCRIALGLSADPYTGRIHQETLVMALEELGDASGRGDLHAALRRETLPVLLATIVGSVETAAAWVELIAAYPDVDPAEVRPHVERAARRRRR